MTRGNGANTTYVREPDDDLAEVTHGFASGSVTSAPFTYVTSPSGQIGSMTVGAAAFQWLAPASYARTYGAPNALNQLASEAGKPITWETLSGLNTGNMASASLDGSATITTFAHDGMNRLTTASNSGMAAAYAYDADDRRTRKTVTLTSTTVTETLWSGTDEIADYDGAGAVLRRVIPGAAIDERVAWVEASGAAHYIHADRLGSTVVVSDGSGAAAETFSYSPYGESDAVSTGTPWRFTGRSLDPETGLYYYRARYYAPRLGQFLETDPIGTKDDPNLYMYVSADPPNRTDPSGKQSLFGAEQAGDRFKREVGTPSEVGDGAKAAVHEAVQGAAQFVKEHPNELGIAATIAIPGPVDDAARIGVTAASGPLKEALMSTASKEAMIAGADLARPLTGTFESAAARGPLKITVEGLPPAPGPTNSVVGVAERIPNRPEPTLMERVSDFFGALFGDTGGGKP